MEAKLWKHLPLNGKEEKLTLTGVQMEITILW